MEKVKAEAVVPCFIEGVERKSFGPSPVTGAVRVENLWGWASECYRSRGINGYNYPVTCRANGEQVAGEEENEARESASSHRLSGVRDIDECCTRDAHSVVGCVSQIIWKKKREPFTDHFSERRERKCLLEKKRLAPINRWCIILSRIGQWIRKKLHDSVHKEHRECESIKCSERKDNADFP